MLELKLSLKNLLGAKLRTFLNVFVLSLSFVIIILLNGLMDGWDAQAKRDSIAWEYGNGHLLHKNFDPLDPFSILEGHGSIPKGVNNLTPILVHQATIYPQGRIMSISMKGGFPKNNFIKVPLKKVLNTNYKYPAVIGKRMAESTKLTIGDEVLIRWRDKNGTYDADRITIVDIFDSDVPTVDTGQLWLDLNTLWQMTGLKNEASFFIANTSYKPSVLQDWKFKSQESLLKLITDLVNQKKYQQGIIYFLLMSIALLAIFDTQVLSIFRRQKEIGTLIALGMTRSRVIKLFTLEGSLYSFFSLLLGGVYGFPLFYFLSLNGFPVPPADQKLGIAIGDFIYPVYGFSLVFGTILTVLISATIVSFLPAKKISKLNPVLALKGKLQ